MAAPDLISGAYLATVWDTAPLSPAQLASLPAIVTAASRAVRTHCNRYFTRRPAIDELYTPARRAAIVLREYPVNAVSRVAGNPTAALTVGNADLLANQRATAALATAGSADLGLAVVGLTLTRWASGVASALSVPFATSPTLGAVAAAVGALGAGWGASAVSGFGAWASADLRAAQGAAPALGADAASFVVHADDLAFAVDERAGILRLDPGSSADPWRSARWGPSLGGAGDDGRDGRREVRVVYDAGFDAIPEDIQYWTAMAAKSFVDRMGIDSALKGETVGAYTWAGRDAMPALPADVVAGLAPWRNVRG